MKKNLAIINQLNVLLEKNFQTEKAYHKAAENISNLALKDFLKEASRQRYNFELQLIEIIKKLGGAPESENILLEENRKDKKSPYPSPHANDYALLRDCENTESAVLDVLKELIHKEGLAGADAEEILLQKEKVQQDILSLQYHLTPLS